MVIIDNFFIQYKTPSQFVYWGENYVDIYRLSDSKKNFNKIRSIENVSLTGITGDGFQVIARELVSVDTGIILNSGQFIFNIFEFDKIPFKENLKDDLIGWRLKKVFPENLDDYEHNYFKLNKNRVISILLKKSLKEKIEILFKESEIPLTYIGNSTMETINYITAKKQDAPDFFIEIDKSLSVVVFLDRYVPFYIRKFRNDQAPDIANEILKTINFVKNSYSKVPQTYSQIIRRSDINFRDINEELAKIKVHPKELKSHEQFIFPI